MDPNRNSLETILKLPTHRLLAAYRSERSQNHFYVEDWVWSCDCSKCVNIRAHRQEVEKRLDPMREELARREHLIRN
jgi:hypothetical protein